MFDGKKTMHWIRQCNRYFSYYNTDERDNIQIAALYFDDKVEKWFYNQLVGRPNLTWDFLSRALLSKYDKSAYNQVVGQFNKLKQTSSLEGYIESFEDLRVTMLEFNPTLS